MAYSYDLPVKTARFANVAFSNGSLPFGFLERLNKNQAWSCPTGIKRFFVSSEESGQLCLIASILGETGDVFFPKLDPKNDSIYFETIAQDLLKYLGLDIDICESEEEAKRKSELLSDSSKSHPVYFFKSDTSGEKLFEELLLKDEFTLTKNKLIMRAEEGKMSWEKLEPLLDKIRKNSNSMETKELYSQLKKIVPEFEAKEFSSQLY